MQRLLAIATLTLSACAPTPSPERQALQQAAHHGVAVSDVQCTPSASECLLWFDIDTSDTTPNWACEIDARGIVNCAFGESDA